MQDCWGRFYSYFHLIVSISLGLFVSVSAYSFSLPPRLSVDASTGGSATVGQADLMLSFDGDQQHNLYVDPQASYGTDEQWYADLGLGYRWIENDAAILGWYVFASRTHVENQAGFWIANPGVEAMGSRWDARINGYIPVAGRSDEIGIVRFNQSSRFVFSGHTERLVTTYVTGDETQQVGNGVDAKMGYQVFRHVPLKAYLGGYFFNIPNADNVRGGAVGVEYWFDQHVKAFVNYTYDNLQYNTVVGGLVVSFGGVDEPRADPSLSERLSDPVERYLANLGHGSKIPSDPELTNLQTGQKSVLSNQSTNNLPENSDSEVVTIDAVFFSQNGAPNNGGVGLIAASCTFENPCGPTDLTNQGVSTLNALFPNTQMYFNGGTYNATDVVGGTSALTLLSGQSLFSRTADYSQPATGAARSIFVGQLALSGNNTISNVTIIPPPAGSGLGIGFLQGEDNVLVTGTQIGSSTDVNARPTIGVGSRGVAPFNQIAVMDNVVIFAQTTGINFGGPSLIVRNSTINVGGNSAFTTGVRTAGDNGAISLQNSQININSTVPTTERGIEAAFSGVQITASDITITLNSSAVGAEIDALVPGNSSTSIIINRGTITANSTAGAAYIVGGAASSTGLVNINQAALAANGSTALIKKAGSGANLTITSSACRVNGSTVIC